MQIVAAVGLSDLVVRETRRRVGEGIAGRVADDAEPLLLVGTIGDERFPIRGERPEIPSSVCAPIMAEGRVLGVLNVNSVPTNDPFDQPEVRSVASWARQIGPAIDRSRQLQQVRGRSFELSVRGSIESIATSKEDLVTRLRRVATRATELLNVDACAIWLHEPKTERLVLRALGGSSSTTMDALSTPIGVGLVGWVAKNRRPLVLRNSPDDPSDVEALRVACAAVPIRHHTDLVGVLTVEWTSGMAMDPNRLALVSTVAGVIGEQVGTSRLQASSEHMVTMLSALSELGVAFGAARERRSLARLVAFTAATVLESDVATVRILREEVAPGSSDADAFEVLASHGASSPTPDDPLSQLEDRVAREVVARRAGVTDVELPAKEATRCSPPNVRALDPMMSDDDESRVVVVSRRGTRGSRMYRNLSLSEIAARLGDYAAAAALRFSHGGGSSRESDQ
jgi:signal transduction protein with GAF and PtsI domain